MVTNIQMTKNVNIHMVRGDSLIFSIKIKGLSGDLSSAYFTARERIATNPITGYTPQLFRKSLNDGITKVGSGEYTVRVAPSDTSGSSVESYDYDLQIGYDNDIFTPIRGILYIDKEVS